MSDPLLERDIRECTTLVEDLDFLIEDLELKHSRSDALIFAVDFSEIFAFAFPEKIGGQLRIFEAEESVTTAVHQRYVLHKLFAMLGDGELVTHSDRLALLDPYGLELANFARRVGSASVESLADDYIAANRELDYLVRNFGSEIQGARELLETTEADESELTRFLEIFEQHAPKMVLLIDRSAIGPRDRVLDLLNKRRLRSLQEWNIRDLSVDSDLQMRWDLALYEVRGDRYAGSCFVDASAMAILHAANKVLGAQGRKLVLVTRSKIMHQLIRREISSGQWGEPSFNPLRHPRYLIPLHTVEGQPIERQIDDLKNLRGSVTLFLDTYDPSSSLPPDRYESDMEKIRERLRSSAGLSGWLTMADSVLTESSRINYRTRERLREFVETSTNRDAFKQRVIERIADLESELERLYQYSGVALHAAELDQGDARAGSLSFALTDRLIVTSNRPEMPYSLEFSSNTLKAWSERVVRADRIDMDEVLTLLSDSFSSSSEYEVLLFIACVFGAWRRWDKALAYCDFALTRHTDRDLPAYEAVFFRGLCYRMMDPSSSETFRMALASINHATRMREEAHRGNGYAGDPRYMKAKASILFLWNMANASGDPRFSAPPPADTREAVQLCERALALSEDDWRLQCDLYNNLCYFFLEANAPAARERARSYWIKLTALLNENEPDKQAWPTNVLDTVIWADYRLNKGKRRRSEFLADYAEMVSLLQGALDIKGLDRGTERTIRQHLEHIARDQRKIAARI
jgi:hypothetical protein